MIFFRQTGWVNSMCHSGVSEYTHEFTVNVYTNERYVCDVYFTILLYYNRQYDKKVFVFFFPIKALLLLFLTCFRFSKEKCNCIIIKIKQKPKATFVKIITLFFSFFLFRNLFFDFETPFSSCVERKKQKIIL